MTVHGLSELGATVTWPQADGTEPVNDSANITTAAPDTTPFTPNLSGTVNATVTWPVVNKAYAPTGLPTLTSTAPTWQQNIVVSGQGNIKIDLTWAWQFNNPDLKLELFDGATLKVSSDSSSILDDSEHWS
jgi:hypothetical protein